MADSTSSTAQNHHLPSQPTSFIGRELEITKIIDLLNNPTCRLLTLVGLGGSGKTRLSLEVAQRIIDNFPDGVYFINLQPLRSSAHILTTIADVLKLSLSGSGVPLQQLISNLREKTLLLILDNFEHLLAGIPLLSQLVENTCCLKILVTSRQILNLQAEWIWEVKGLTYPETFKNDRLDTYSAVRLFEERARRSQHDFALHQEAEGVIRLCQLVDGMPLALELAASWTKTLSSASIFDQIQQNIDFLTTRKNDLPSRHRSMRAVFDRSWHLLSADEQAVFRRLSIFRGGFTLAAGKYIVGASLSILASLIEKSLVYRETAKRYGMHELVRQYAEERLVIAKETEEVIKRHGEYYSDFIQQREQDLYFSNYETISEVAVDFQNIHAAWDWAVDRTDFRCVERLVEGINRFSVMSSRWQDIESMLTSAITSLESQSGEDNRRLKGHLLIKRGDLRMLQNHYAEAETDLKQGLTIVRQLDEPHKIAHSLWVLAMVKQFTGQPDLAREMVTESVALCRQTKRKFGLASALNYAASIANWQGHLDECDSFAQECLMLRRDMGDMHGIAHNLNQLGDLELRRGRWDVADIHSQESLRLRKLFSGPYFQAMSHCQVSEVALFHGEFEVARQHAEQVRSLGCAVTSSAVQAVALVTLTVLADILGKNLKSEQLPELIPFFPTNTLYGWIQCNLKQFDSATENLSRTLADALSANATGELLLILAGISRILAHRGEKLKVVEILGCIVTHPRSPRKLFDNFVPLIDLQRKLENELGKAVYTNAWKQGQTLDLEQKASQVLKQLGSTLDDSITQANQALIEPLTLRELEVLALVADGLTNPIIANRLFITTGTVKGHVNKILHKLDVDTRQQAAIRALEQGLVKS